MEYAPKVRMLGEFSIQNGEAKITDQDNRTRKVWLLLAYIIYNRNRIISQEDLIDLLWHNSDSSSNPANALKTMLHRVRSLLNQLGQNAGHDLIIRKNGTYSWRPDCNIIFDIDIFQALQKQGMACVDEDKGLELLLQALSIYQGDFLVKLCDEPWVMPHHTYLHHLFIETVHAVIPILEKRNRITELIDVARHAIALEPYDEQVYQSLMRALMKQDEKNEIIKVFNCLTSQLSDNFGLLPSSESKALFRQALHVTNTHQITLNTIRDQMQPLKGTGAFYCDYDFFTVIYQELARVMVRSGDAAHIALLTVTGKEGRELSRRSLDLCMENLKQQLCNNLRQGDVIAMCSISQYVIILPQANYENSCIVMDRIIKCFYRQYPHTPAELLAMVQPIEAV